MDREAAGVCVQPAHVGTTEIQNEVLLGNTIFQLLVPTGVQIQQDGPWLTLSLTPSLSL